MDNIKKFVNNKLVLYMFPHFSYISIFFYYYVIQQKYDYEILFSEVLFFCFVCFLITNILMLIINKYIKNIQLSSLSVFIYAYLEYIIIFSFDSTKIIILSLILILILFIFVNYTIKNKNSFNFIYFLLFIFISCFSLCNIIMSVYNKIDLISHTDSSNADYVVKVDKNKKSSPNIYYIHCDGMMNISDMEKYFNYEDDTFEEYLSDNEYYYNVDASFVGGHRTQKALVAIFNPYYYDNKEKNFLNSLENYYLGKSSSVSNYINYKEIANKRFNNELISGLRKKNYNIYQVLDSNSDSYAMMEADYYFDISHYNISDNERKKYAYLNISHLKRTFKYTISNNVYSTVYYNTKKISNLSLDSYKYLSSSDNYKLYRIIKSLNNIYKKDSKKFVFIDFDFVHLPNYYDEFGNIIDEKYRKSLNYYTENYIYSSYILTDILSYIKDNDDNAIIILQADHGLHVFSDLALMESLNISKNQLYEIRNSTINAVYVPEKYKNGDEIYLGNPLNISRYIINNYVGENYEYLN